MSDAPTSLLDDILVRFHALPEKEQEELRSIAQADIQRRLWVPTPGPQSDAYYSKADILLYGGEAGGAKSDLLLGLAFTAHKNSLVMRRQYSDLSGMTERAVQINRSRKGFNGSPPPKLRTDDGRLIEFGAAQHLGDEEAFQGRPHDLLCVGRGTPVLMGDGAYRAIDTLCVGDLVQTLEGPRRVNVVHPVQRKQAVRITAHRDGRVLFSQVQSRRHEVLTSAGWASYDTFVSTRRASSSSPIQCQALRIGEGSSSRSYAPHGGILPEILSRLRQISARSQALLESAHSFAREIFAFLALRGPGSDAVMSCASFPEIAPHRVSTCLQEPLRHPHAGDFFWRMFGQLTSWYGANDARSASESLGLTDHYSEGFRPCGEHIPESLGPCSHEARGLLYLHQLSDAERSSPTYSARDDLGKIHRHTFREGQYAHPYTMDIRHTSAAVSECSFSFEILGVEDLFDIEVDELNHYITAGGFINKNCFDEAWQFAISQIRFLMTWLRSTDPAQRCRVVMASNPPVDVSGEWMVQMFAPWLDPSHYNPAKSGELRWYVSDEEGKDKEVSSSDPVKIGSKFVQPLSRTFIRSRLSDNPFLARTGYAAQLDNLPEPYRSAFRDGNFLMARKDAPRQAIPTQWVREAQARWTPKPPENVPMCAIGCDIAQGGDDEFVMAPRHDMWFAPMICVPGSKVPDGPTGAGLIIANRRENAAIIIDMGGGYGGSTYDHLKDNGFIKGDLLFVFKGAETSTARTADNQLGYTNKRSEAYWRFREALDPSQAGGSPVALPPDPMLVADLTAPTFEITPRGIKLETKEDVVKKLGRSPDRGDAVVIAATQGAMASNQLGGWKPQSKYGPRPNVIRGHSAQRDFLRR